MAFHKLEVRARYLYIGLPALAMALFLMVGNFLAHSVANEFARQLAWKYSFEAAANFQISTHSEFLLMNQVSHSAIISRWMNDQYNVELRTLAHQEMSAFARNSPNTQRMMFTIYDSLTAYDFFIDNEKVDLEDFAATYHLDDGGEAGWFYNARTSDSPFILNIQRQRAELLNGEIELFLWLNHRIYYEEDFVGTVTIGFPFDYAHESIFAHYDPAYIRGFVIDENGLIRVDSAGLLNLHEDGFPTPKPLPEAVGNPNLVAYIQEHLTLKQNGVFLSHHLNDEVIPLVEGPYRYASISPILGTSWSIIVFSNYEEFVAGRYLPIIILTFVVLFISILWGSMTVKQAVISPLLTLTQRASDAVDLAKKPNISGLDRQDELGDLARTILTLRESLEQSVQEAQAANRSKSDFLSTISHEIRTPMNTIMGMSTIGRGAPETNRKNYAFDQIQVASYYLLGIINDVLDMSKIEVGNLMISKTPFSLTEVIQSVQTINRFKMEEKQQQLQVDIAPDIPERLMGDDQRLAQILTNLVSNAVKFTPHEQAIRIQVELVSSTENDCVLELKVIDQGMGILPEQQEQIFKPFVQADRETSRKYGGTGLGLTISKQLAEMMGGQLTVSSIYGQGATFIARLPFAIAAQIPPKTQPLTKVPDYSAYRILVADDAALNREIVIALLEPTGIGIAEAENGQETVRLFKEAPESYDLIFMDMHMPVLSGIEATKEIRHLEQKRRKKVPIIAITANAFQQDIEKCLKAGMDAHLAKPLVLESILAILERFLYDNS